MEIKMNIKINRKLQSQRNHRRVGKKIWLTKYDCKLVVDI